jgi:hypothetical protein
MGSGWGAGSVLLARNVTAAKRISAPGTVARVLAQIDAANNTLINNAVSH